MNPFKAGQWVVLDEDSEDNRAGSIYARKLREHGRTFYVVRVDGSFVYIDGLGDTAFSSSRFKLAPGSFIPNDAVYMDVKPSKADDKIAVYDNGNVDRLLGYLTERPVANLRGRYVSVCVAPQMATAMYHVNEDFSAASFNVSRVDFTYAYKLSADGYTQNAVFRTDAKLETLMDIRTFVLPGESYDAAKRRRYMRGYGG